MYYSLKNAVHPVVTAVTFLVTSLGILYGLHWLVVRRWLRLDVSNRKVGLMAILALLVLLISYPLSVVPLPSFVGPIARFSVDWVIGRYSAGSIVVAVVFWFFLWLESFLRASFILLPVYFFLMGRSIVKNRKQRIIATMKIYATAGSATAALTIAAPFLVFWLVATCDSYMKIFHHFNGHLKSLCVQRDDLSECPQDEQALRAFNPPMYGKLQQCAKTYYEFDGQAYTWLVKFSDTKVFIAHPKFDPKYRFGVFSLRESDSELSFPLYPPDFDGPWDRLPE